MNRVLTLRQLKRMTQDAFAEFCDVSRISIARYEAGCEVGRKNAERIAAACKVSIEYVLGYTTENIPLKEPSWNQVPDLSDEETHLIIDYRCMSTKGQRRVRETVSELKILYPPKS